MADENIWSVLKEPINNLANPVATTVGQTVADMWDFIFGGFSTFVAKKRHQHNKDIEDFKKSLVHDILKIPENDLQEPPLSILGPALESSKYYIEDKKVRELFAQLIARSMDKRYNGKVHVSFLSTIQQMNALDVQNISMFSKNDILPIASYSRKASNGGHYYLAPLVFLSNPNVTDVSQQALSISSLERLGLIKTTFESYFVNEAHYDIFKKSESYNFLHSIYKDDLVLGRGEVSLTALGKAFIEVCLPSSPVQSDSTSVSNPQKNHLNNSQLLENTEKLLSSI